MRSRRSPQSPCAMSLSASSFTEGRRAGRRVSRGGVGGVVGAETHLDALPVPVLDRVVRRERSGIVAVMDRDEKLLATAEVHGEMLESLRARRRGSRAKRRQCEDGGRRPRRHPQSARRPASETRGPHDDAPVGANRSAKSSIAHASNAPPGSARADVELVHLAPQTP